MEIIVNPGSGSSVSVDTGPVEFVKNGVDTQVEKDTGTPGNSEPLPVEILVSGSAISPATQTTAAAILTELQLKADLSETQPVSAASLPLPTGASTEATLASLLTELQGKADLVETQPVSAASLPLPTGAATEATLSTLNGKVTAVDTGAVVVSSSALPTGAATEATLSAASAKLPAAIGPQTAAASLAVVQAPLANGSVANTTLTATDASTASAPANAIGFILHADDDNTHDIRWCIGATASTTVGLRMAAGRDTGYVPCAANVSVCATTSGTNAFAIQWILRS